MFLILVRCFSISELPQATSKNVPSFLKDGGDDTVHDDEAGKIVFELSFKYGKHKFRGDAFGSVSVTVEKE